MLMIPTTGSRHFKVGVAPFSKVLSRIFGANSILEVAGGGLCSPMLLWEILAPHSGTCPSLLDAAPSVLLAAHTCQR